MTLDQDVTIAPHACTVPVSDEQIWEMTARFLADGLAAGERVIYFEDGGADALLQRLDDDRVAYRIPMQRGQFEIVPAVVTRQLHSGSAGQLLDAVDGVVTESLDKGFPSVRLSGDGSHGLALDGGAMMLEYESKLDTVLGPRPGRMLCMYDRGRFPEDMIERLRALHDTEVVAPAVYDDSLLRITSSGPSTARVAGEVDHSNRPRIKRLLEVALDDALRSHSSSTEITLDLSSLRFLDVAGAVSLVHAAEEFPSTHRLVLTGVRPGVARLLDRCGAPFAEQLRVDPRMPVVEPVDDR
ncbi:MEDS domain-containing protein [Pseudonocardia saturnea]